MSGGMRGMNPRQMQKAMRSMGIKQNEMQDVLEVIIRTKSQDIVLRNPDVLCIEVKGSKSYQVSGEEEIRPAGSSDTAAKPAKYNTQDIDLVMSQTGCDEAKAIEALDAVDGQPAEAIIKIMSE